MREEKREIEVIAKDNMGKIIIILKIIIMQTFVGKYGWKNYEIIMFSRKDVKVYLKPGQLVNIK